MRRIEDVTRELTALEDRIAFALSTNGIGIWEWQPDQNLSIWDNNMLRLFGVDSSEYYTESFFKRIVHPDDWQIVKNQFNASLNCNEPFDIRFRIIYNNTDKYIRMRGTVRCNTDGTYRRLIGIAFEDK